MTNRLELLALARVVATLMLALGAPVRSSAAAPAAAVVAPIVTLEGRAAAGQLRDGVEQFLALPFGAAPVGALRWNAPLAAAPWSGTRDATVPPPRCPQSLAGLAAGLESEDCLYLNVYRPATPAARPRAVFVYVHGGGATNGSANDHDGAALARRGGIIVVTLNYRLGALGFMASEHIAAGAADGQAGNYALHDVRLALEWVRDSIRHFGGDPARVTVGGESAGGTMVCPLLTWPRAAGLFRAAIISSDDCLHDVDTSEQAGARAAALALRLGCADSACLRSQTAAALIKAAGAAAPNLAPGGVIADYPAALIAKGRWHAVPLLMGANLDEGRIAAPGFFKYDAARYRTWLDGLLAPGDAARVLKAYRAEHRDEPFEYAYKISAVITDSGMRGFGGCTSLRLARAAARQAPVYFYQFEDRGAPSGDQAAFRFGAAHAAELPYLWPAAGGTAQAAGWSAPQRKLSDNMIGYWSAFVRNGRPAADGLPGWPGLAGGKPRYMAFRPGGSASAPLAHYARQHRCGLWDRLPVIMQRGES